MKLDPALWADLEGHGVSEAHLRMLLQILQTSRNGSVSWHFAQGSLCTCDVRLTFPSRRAEVARVSEALLEGNSLLR